MICEPPHIFRTVLFLSPYDERIQKYMICLKCGEGLPKNLEVRNGVIVDEKL